MITVDNPFLDEETREVAKPKKASVYGRTTVTDIDLALMHFMASNGFTTIPQAALVLKVAKTTARKRLLGLQEEQMGYVKQWPVPGARRLWYVTKSGIDLLIAARYASPEELSNTRADKINLQTIGHKLAVNQVIAHIIAGTPNVFGSQIETPKFEQLVTETAIRRAWGTLAGNFEKKDLYGVGWAGEQLKRSVLVKVKNGELKMNQILDEEPALWTLTSRKVDPMPTKQFHHPDLVVNLEAGRGMKAQSIAVEVELSEKTADEYEKIMRTYKEDKFVYARRIWITQSEKIVAKAAKAAEKVGLKPDEVLFVNLLGADGQPFYDHAWKL